MNILYPVLVAACLFVLAARFYPYWIARVFGENDDNLPPSEKFADGKDYVKSKTPVVFAHHFATIAGAGPIIGPIVALAFGWGPAWAWAILGGIFIGAVHDMSTMFVSLREGGKSIAEIARRTLGPGGFLLLIAFLLIALTIVNAIFLIVSAKSLTSMIPLDKLNLAADQSLLFTMEDNGVVKGKIGGIATTSVFVITGLAPLLGWWIHRKGLPTLYAFIWAGVVCIGAVVLGFYFPVTMDMKTWQYVLAAYVFFASLAPVWLILQPRDFTNVQILYGGIILLVVGSLVAGFNGATTQAPVLDLETGAKALKGPIWPMLFITVACGAISGFHCLVTTGTTSKQLPRESDCRRIGFNGMLLESFLAVLVVTAVASQLNFSDQYLPLVHPEAGSGNWVLAFAIACGNLFHQLGIPLAIGSVLGILVLEGFLVTTLDTSVRLTRYLLEELWNFIFSGNTPTILKSRITNTAIAVAAMLVFVFAGTAGALWGIFGSANQLIGALALTTVAVWLLQRARSWWFAGIPAVIMLVTAGAALWKKVQVEMAKRNDALTKIASDAFEGKELEKLEKVASGASILGTAGTVLLVLVGIFALFGIWKFFKAIQDNAAGKTKPLIPDGN